MREVSYSVACSLDGFIAGPDEAMDWMFGPLSDRVRLQLVESRPIDSGCVVATYGPES